MGDLDKKLRAFYQIARVSGINHELVVDEDAWIAQIKQAFLDCLPGEHPDSNVPSENLNAQEAGEVIGYNQALSDIKKVLE